jgi:predicted kinase
MAKMIILMGLPASGKSTYAAQLLQQYGNAIRINRDLLRTMLHCDVWSGKNERLTKNAARTLARHFLARDEMGLLDLKQGPGVVIIDDTNLVESTLASWKQLAEMCGASWEIVDMPTDVAECLRRDRLREKPVGDHVIIGMALQSHRYPMPEHGIVLCDIDGTVADCTHRRRFLQQEPKDWDGFFRAMGEDSVIDEVATQVLNSVDDGYQLFYVSGRPDIYRFQTEGWLAHMGLAHHKALFMRRTGDHRPDTVVKQEMLDRYFPEPYRSQIVAVYDDRPSVIREVWEKAGLPVTRCGTGEEF